VLTSQSKELDVSEWFKKLVEIYKKDQELPVKKQKYANLLDVVIFFVPEEDFQQCTAVPEVPQQRELKAETKFGRYLELLKEWGGIDTDRLLFYLKDVNPAKIEEAIGMTEEAILQMQEQEAGYQSKLLNLTQSNQVGELD
jgi:hypothetical protein